MLILMTIAFSWTIHIVEAPSSATLLTESMELLQKNDKPKALKLLEKAFEKSGDPDELRQICILILEASPNTYPKREAYLRYLVKFNSEHAEAYKWCKELGDRAFDSGKLEEAEDWYLRALSGTEDKISVKILINYKLAFVRWNMKKPIEALQAFLEIYPTAEPSLQTQMKTDLAKLSWDIGTLPTAHLERLLSLPEIDLNEIISKIFEIAPRDREFTENEQNLLIQLKANEKTKPAAMDFLQSESTFKKTPCFPFSLLTPEDHFSTNLLLACTKIKDKVSKEKLISFFAQIKDGDEKTLWAYAELLMAADKTEEAAVQILSSGQFESRSKNFLSFAENLILQLNEVDFKALYPRFEVAQWEKFYSLNNSAKLLERLEATDPEVWILFEEKKIHGKVPKAFLLKKGDWLARKPEVPIDDLRQVFEKLLEPPMTNNSKKIAKNYSALKEKSGIKLPSTFSKAFKLAFDKWVSDLDKLQNGLSDTTPEWRLIAEPVFKVEIKKNVDAIIAQLDATTLDPELAELTETFQQKKEELKQDLRSKYLVTEASPL
ncbi:MAG: hypothetical protein JWQ35_2581 [Bacteriovoracaceae bacterium]|nr:hypothetical protein [Bacteriovoracaceae bacterium]